MNSVPQSVINHKAGLLNLAIELNNVVPRLPMWQRYARH